MIKKTTIPTFVVKKLRHYLKFQFFQNNLPEMINATFYVPFSHITLYVMRYHLSLAFNCLGLCVTHEGKSGTDLPTHGVNVLFFLSY